MSDPRNDAHDKKVSHEKNHEKKHQAAEPVAAVAVLAEETPAPTPDAALEGSLTVLAQLKDLEFHSRAHLERLAQLTLTVDDELKQKELASPLSDVYAAQNNVQTKLTTLIEAYKAECDRLQA